MTSSFLFSIIICQVYHNSCVHGCFVIIIICPSVCVKGLFWFYDVLVMRIYVVLAFKCVGKSECG